MAVQRATALRWAALFQQLRDVRRWGVQDRLQETGILDDWEERIEHDQEVVPCEIELWYRRNPEKRRDARNRVAMLVDDVGGRVVAEADIEEIAYHSLLVRLPAVQIEPLVESLDNEIELVQCEQIQFFRATGQMSSSVPEDIREQDQSVLPEPQPAGVPVVALLDGLPLQAHRRLRGRLIVDDPDGFEVDYPAATRRHGTAMASLILFGDIASGDVPLARPLYVRPILQQDARDWRNHTETVPEGTLVVDLIHRAVRRLFEGDGDDPPVAAQVAVVNLSIGIQDRPFDQSMSPLARLLDWLAWRYRVLFVDIDRVRECTARRVTVLGGGELRRDESHIHRVPLPPSLSGVRGYRRSTMTLAWLSPVNPRHQAWRRADLWFAPPKDPLQVNRQQADWQAVQRGTLQHEILEGEEAGVYVDGASLEIQVSCRASAGALEDEIPYALAVTLEIAEELDIDIYDEVRSIVQVARIRAEADA